jgi:hypothetical protein
MDADPSPARVAGEGQTMTERQREPDPYWTHDQLLGVVRLGHASWHVHARSHIETEQLRGVGSETLFRVSVGEGSRTYVQSRLYLHAPPDSTREERVADAQSWFYPADRTIVIWELIPKDRFRQEDPREDLTLRDLWLRYEAFLTAKFRSANRLLTTWDDLWERDPWQGFLNTLGYHQTGPAVFAKDISSNPHAR